KQNYRAHVALLPDHRMNENWWKTRHLDMNRKASSSSHDLLFIGDSITQGWEGAGKATWENYYGKRKALNLGISGDRTEHVIWRLDNGNLRRQQKAKAAVVMIGTNNTGHSEQDPGETADGVARILSILRARCPSARVLLLGVFPRDAMPDGRKRRINDALNERLAAFHDGKRVHYLNINDQFLDGDGRLPKEIMPDYLHPRQKGYAIWAEAIEAKLVALGL
ncbi:MAG: acetylglucosamine-6-sulfatase, partial [Roseibacillus sp.]|nr:acetylglucosamine-6-sulfatase [Roseibacillus sp.]